MKQSDLHTQRQQQVALAQLLVQRLERLSADSVWAHRASGARGGLLRLLEDIEAAPIETEAQCARLESDLQRLARLTALGFEMLTNAAVELIT